VPLALYAATAHARLRRLGVTAPGATIALAGGLLASSALALSGALIWTLSRPGVRSDGPLVRGFDDLAFATGGPLHVIGLGLLVAGIAVPSLILGFVPRWVAIAGLVIAVACELTTLVLATQQLAPLIPTARFPALIWLLGVGSALPRRRTTRAERRAPASAAP